jgi:serine acetyltransferase
MTMPDAPARPPLRFATDAERLTWRQTRHLMRSDFVRLATWYGGGSFSRRLFWFLQPNYQALFLYRTYRYLYLKGWRGAARLVFLWSLYWTGAEISPTTSLGPGCLITHASGVVLFGKIGARFTIFGQGGMGGGLGEEDIGGGPGYPVIGDDVIFGMKALALGPIRIGDRVKVGPTALVSRSVPDDAMILAVESKLVRVRMGEAEGNARP